jgi:hypothetical protein
LPNQIARFGPGALLVTTSSEGPPHVSSVTVRFAGDHLAMGAGRTTRANVAEHPAVALVWSGGTDPDHCLIVDALVHESADDSLVVRPASAVLHRLATAPATVPECPPPGP